MLQLSPGKIGKARVKVPVVTMSPAVLMHMAEAWIRLANDQEKVVAMESFEER